MSSTSTSVQRSLTARQPRLLVQPMQLHAAPPSSRPKHPMPGPPNTPVVSGRRSAQSIRLSHSSPSACWRTNSMARGTSCWRPMMISRARDRLPMRLSTNTCTGDGEGAGCVWCALLTRRLSLQAAFLLAAFVQAAFVQAAENELRKGGLGVGVPCRSAGSLPHLCPKLPSLGRVQQAPPAHPPAHALHKWPAPPPAGKTGCPPKSPSAAPAHNPHTGAAAALQTRRPPAGRAGTLCAGTDAAAGARCHAPPHRPAPLQPVMREEGREGQVVAPRFQHAGRAAQSTVQPKSCCSQKRRRPSLSQ